MIDTFLCRGCNRNNYFGMGIETEYVFEKNNIYVMNGRCNYCREPFFYERVKGKPLEQFLFLNQNDVIFPSKRCNKILCTYTPIIKDNELIKQFYDKNKNEYVSVGINGYEDFVLDKSFLGNWYMTINKNPLCDLSIYSVYLGMQTPDVLLSYIPSPLLKMNGIQYKYIFERDEEYYKNASDSIIDVYKDLYVGVKR